MRFPYRIYGIKFVGLLAIIILVASTLGCLNLVSDKNNSSSSPNAKVTPPTPEANITFVTTGSSFSPIITVTGNPKIQWVFGDGSTSDSTSPTVNFGSAGTRANTLVVTPWSAVTKINI